MLIFLDNKLFKSNFLELEFGKIRSAVKVVKIKVKNEIEIQSCFDLKF